MFISAFMATICLVLIVAAVFSYTFIEQGYAYWGAQGGEGNSGEVETVGVGGGGNASDITQGIITQDYSTDVKAMFNPSAKYFTYVVNTSKGQIPATTTLSNNGGIALTAELSGATATSISIVGYTGTVSNIALPSNLKVKVAGSDTEVSLSVTSVSGINSSSTVALTSISIPKTITSIGANCFSGYRATLTEIKFEAGGTYVLGAQAFRFSKGANTVVMYGDTRITSNTVGDADGNFSSSAFSFGTGVFLGWVGN